MEYKKTQNEEALIAEYSQKKEDLRKAISTLQNHLFMYFAVLGTSITYVSKENTLSFKVFLVFSINLVISFTGLYMVHRSDKYISDINNRLIKLSEILSITHEDFKLFTIGKNMMYIIGITMTLAWIALIIKFC